MDYKKLLQFLGFSLKDNAIGVYFKKYHDSTIIEVDLEKQIIHFGGTIKIYDKEHQNIVKPEDWVVFECVDRLLTKGYRSADLILENVWKTGHGTSGRIDILVKNNDKAFLMIECKIWGGEFEKEYKNMQKDGGQLFTYFQQDKNAQFLMLYASQFDGKQINYKNEIIKIEESYRDTSNVKDLYARWNKFTKQNGIFDDWVRPYNFESKALTRKDLIKIKQADSSIIFNRFLEILRHNTVSDKPNAFNKMFTLFLCKIHDEGTKGENEELDFQFKEGIDTDITFQTRLTDLYKRGMMEFLSKEITDFSDADFNNEFGDIDINVRNRILEKITKLRLQKNNEFAIKEVFDEDRFADNAKVLKEVVELLQVYQIRYAEKQPFLGDFFELLLTTGLKQESGQFFTPVPIARFICKSIPLDRIVSAKLQAGDATDLLPTTIDYAAGSGHFLTESMEEIQNIIHSIDETTLKPNVAKEIKKRKGATFDWAGEYMYGIEKDYRLVKTAKVGCYLHGDGVATVIHGDGLDSFEFSKSYKHKLKKFNTDDKQENAQFDLVLSNPPYSVSAFKGNLDGDKALKDFDLFDGLSDRSSEIECLFIERTKQLLKEGGIAALVLPSSILSNSGIYTKAREIILRNFDIISIVSLGSGTFMATGTNTVTVFMRKRNKYFARNLQASINTFFTNLVDVSLNGIEQVFSKYVSEIRGVNLENYKTLCQGNPNNTIQTTELYQDYSKKLKLTKNESLTDCIIEIEKEKILYFVLSYNQQVVLVKSGDKQVEKEFLGYEFSTRKGSEGIHAIQGGKSIDQCTKLFDPDTLDNDTKVSTYIYDGFNNHYDRPIHDDLKAHVSRIKLVDLITFDRVEFEKTILTNVKKKIRIESKWKGIKVEDAIDSVAQNIVKIQKKDAQSAGKYPVISQESDKIIGYSDLDCPITELPLVIFGDHNKVVKYIDVPFFVGADGVKLLKPKKEFLPKYFYSIVESIKFDGIQSYQRHYSILKDIQIPLPPLEVQQKIVDEIEILEKKEKNNREKVEKLKDEIEKVIGGISGESKKMSDLMSIVRGASPRPINEFQTNDKSGVNRVKIGDVKPESKYITDTKERITIEGAKKSRFVNEGDFILSNSMSFGRPYIMKINGCIHDGWLLLTDFINGLDKNYLYNILTSDLVQNQFRGLAGGGTSVDNLNIDKVSSVKIPLPPLEVQQQIVAQIEAIEEQITTLEAELAQIPGQKQAILTKYL